jgi:formylglycine-generating enzyme required for sulfatase activity
MKMDRKIAEKNFNTVGVLALLLPAAACHGNKQTSMPQAGTNTTRDPRTVKRARQHPGDGVVAESGGHGQSPQQARKVESRKSRCNRFMPRKKTETIRVALQRIAGKWVKVPKGSFWMGSPKSEVGRCKNETRHRVTLTNSYLMKATEVTKEEFSGVMGYDPSYYHRGRVRRAVNQVTWHEAAKYCNRVSQLVALSGCYDCKGRGPKVKCTGKTTYASIHKCPGVRLPTEAEWEYAARAGTSTATYNGNLKRGQLDIEKANPVLDPIAWYAGNAVVTSEVGQKKPNAWGLYDMLGNVCEWCHDWYKDRLSRRPVVDPEGPKTGKMKVYRGGSFAVYPRFIRAANRDGAVPDLDGRYGGFRTVVSFSSVGLSLSKTHPSGKGSREKSGRE